mgnify:CR=1 FL=1
MTADAAFARVAAAGWFVEDCRQCRGNPASWPEGPWCASVRNRTGERIEQAHGHTPAEALGRAMDAALRPLYHPELESLLG